MSFFIGLLTFVMVLDCLVLILLILIQLPKKDAGAGLAFGGAASDALFGAGSGTVLTKVTKYAATTFFALAIVLAMLQSRFSVRTGSEFQKILDTPGAASGSAALTTSAPPATVKAATNVLSSVPAATSAPAPVSPEAPAPKK